MTSFLVRGRVDAAGATGETGPAAGFVLGRRPALDGLRGLAVLAVLAVHTVPNWMPGASIGVDLFFVLSGFLITSLLLREHQTHKSIHLGRFYLGRALRLAPALLALLAVDWIVVLGIQSPTAAWQPTALRKDSISILFYFYNWRMSYTPTVPHNPALGPVWSLSVEEQFYLLWPLLLSGLLALRARRRWIVGLLLLGLIVPGVLRVLLWTGVESFPRLYMCTHTRLDGLSAGCLVALLAAWGPRPATRWARAWLRAAAWTAFAVLTGVALKIPGDNWIMYHGGFTVVSLCGAVVIAALVGAPPRLLAWLLQARPLCWVGRISYGVYLWHIPVLLYLAPFMDSRPKALLAWVPILAVGALSHYWVERPFLRLKERLGRGRSAARPQLPLKAAA